MSKISVKVSPQKRKSRLVSCEGGVFKIEVAATPEGGKANRELIKLLSKKTGVPLSRISVFSGAGSRNKIIEFEDAKADISEILKNSMEEIS